MPVTRRRRLNPDQPENNNDLTDQTDSTGEPLTVEQTPTASVDRDNAEMPLADNMPFPPVAPTAPGPTPVSNGDRVERQEYTPSIEGGRRTARGELFRRPPQVPTQPAVLVPLQAPTHEMSLPLGNLLHLAYNPGYTGSDEARSMLLSQLADESKAGGRARCWNCGSIAIFYDRWNTRSKTFGEIGIAMCEICGVWSVM